MSIALKCVNWNAARYEQKFNYELALALLLEETEELLQAKDAIDTLDAIGDITFVAMGVMWKLGCKATDIHAFFYNADVCHMSAFELHDHMNYIMEYLISIANETDYGTIPAAYLACYSTFIIAIGKLRALNMQSSFYDIVDAICESNNTKEVKGKTDPAIKANVVKGSSYVPPTERLTSIYRKAQHG